jgi:hypothetical protein
MVLEKRQEEFMCDIKVQGSISPLDFYQSPVQLICSHTTFADKLSYLCLTDRQTVLCDCAVNIIQMQCVNIRFQVYKHVE